MRRPRLVPTLRAAALLVAVGAVGATVAVALRHGGTYDAAYVPPAKEAPTFVGHHARWTPAGPTPTPVPAAIADDLKPLGRNVACDDIDGEVVARTRRWRVVHVDTGDLYGKTPVVACRRDRGGPAPVRLLAMAGWAGGDEDSDAPSPEGGPYVASGELRGDRLLLTTSHYATTFGSDGFGEETQTDHDTLVDLARGASYVLPGRAEYDNTSPTETSRYAQETTLFTAEGAIATVWARGSAGASHRRSLQPLFIWDARGPRTVVGRYDTLALSGRRGAERGLYLRSTGGRVRVLPLTGAARTDGLASTRALAWRSMALPEITSAERQDGRGGYNLDEIGIDGPWLSWTGHGNTDPNARIRISIDGPGSRVVGELAPHSYHDFRVISDGLQTAMVVGRFTTDPGELRLRLIGKYQPADAFFDRPATPAMLRPGNAITVHSDYGGKGTYAVSDGTSLLFWGPHGGAVHRAPGLHGLAAAVPVGGAHRPLGVFATTADGEPRLYTR